MMEQGESQGLLALSNIPTFHNSNIPVFLYPNLTGSAYRKSGSKNRDNGRRSHVGAVPTQVVKEKNEMKRNRNRRRRGFTLMEVLLVLVILMMLAGLATISYRQVRKSAKRKEAKMQISLFKQAVEVFDMNYGRYPSNDEGLEILIVSQDGEKPIFDSPTIPLDPWQREYVYELSDDDTFRIWSHGPNESDDSDDISSDLAEN
jgi:general secretion pathway protein G